MHAPTDAYTIRNKHTRRTPVRTSGMVWSAAREPGRVRHDTQSACGPVYHRELAKDRIWTQQREDDFASFLADDADFYLTFLDDEKCISFLLGENDDVISVEGSGEGHVREGFQLFLIEAFKE